MKDILDEIIKDKYAEVAAQKKIKSTQEVREQAFSVCRKTLSMRQVLDCSPSGIISEIKRKSPSKGWIKQEADVENIAVQYQQNGASAISVLTDEKYFGGSLDFLQKIRAKTSLPLLRKDFIVDQYQIYQARIAGADAVLLIASALKPDQCEQLIQQSHELHLEVLLEIHSQQELPYTALGADMIGVNNRHLGTFTTNVENSFLLSSSLSKDALLVSESGISQPEIVKRLRKVGYRGFLIGENFMKTPAPGQALNEFIQSIK